MVRLQRVGRKNIPIFRVVVTDKRNSTKSGKYLETVGTFDPRQDGIRQFNGNRIKHWIAQGAKPSGTVWNLLVDEKIIEGKKVNVSPSKREKEKTAGAPETSTNSKDLGGKQEVKLDTGQTEVKGSEVKVEMDTKKELPASAAIV